MSDTEAQWTVTLSCECPGCDRVVDLLDHLDFWDGRKIQAAEHRTPRTTDMEVICPKCGHEFTADCEY